MRINNSRTLFESFQQNLRESEYYYKMYNNSGEIDYIEFDSESEAEDYAREQNKKTGNETAVYCMSNDECIAVFDKKEIEESKINKVNLKEVYKMSRHKNLNESVESFTKIVWGNDASLDYLSSAEISNLKDLYNKICDAEDEYQDGELDLESFLNVIKEECKQSGFSNEEIEAVLDFYEKSYSYKDDEPEDSFTMYNSDYDKSVDVYKGEDGKWHDSEGNRYMGYLTKQDVKSYFKGNWIETK